MSVDSSDLLQLRLENSELRTRLDASRTDESKSELLKLLEEQTSQTNLLQGKCDELAAGFVEIDKERRALRKSADDARREAMHRVEVTRGECDERCLELKGHLHMKEKEVDALAERTREQERRIEAIASESKKRTEELEGELEELISMVENEREERKKLEGDYERAMEMTRMKDGELEERKLAEEHLERQIKEIRQTLQDDTSRWKTTEGQLLNELRQKEEEMTNLLRDQQLSKIEHGQALQTMEDELKVQRADFASQCQDMAGQHQSEKAELIGTLQSQIDDKSSTIQILTSEIEQLRSNHAKEVSQLQGAIQECKEETQAIESSYANSLETASQLQDEITNLSSSHQIAQEELKAANYLLEKENGGLAEDLDATKVQLANTKEHLSGVQNDHGTLQSEHVALQREYSQLEAVKSSLQKENGELAGEWDDTKAQLTGANETLSGIRTDYAMLQSEHASLQQDHSQLKTARSLLEKESGDLAEEFDRANAQFARTTEQLNSLQSEYTALQSECASLHQGRSQLEGHVSTLEGQIEKLAVDHQEETHRSSQQMSAINSQLNEEKNVSNKLRSQLRDLNIQLKEHGSANQKEKHMLQRQLESVKDELSAREEEASNLRAGFEEEVNNHKSDMELIQNEHAAQMMAIETRGADVVSDLESGIAELEKELANIKLEHVEDIRKMQQTMQVEINNVNIDKDRVECSLAEKEKKMVEQEKKTQSLTAYAKERKEEVRSVKNELTRVKHALESANREGKDAVAAVQDELENARVLYGQEISDLQQIANDVRAELTIAQERLAADDGELERAKETLSERTNLLREMVNQTTAYQGDYEREHSRANHLDEAVTSYKKQLAEVRDMAQRLEGEIRDKDTHYCDAIRNERQQRKTMESELKSSRKMLDDVSRKMAEIEKEKSALKDKVSRQEKYIGRLQDREKQNRRTPAMHTTASTSNGKNHKGPSSRIVRPSTAGSSVPKANTHRGKGTVYAESDENDSPNIGKFGIAKRHLIQSTEDESASLLG